MKRIDRRLHPGGVAHLRHRRIASGWNDQNLRPSAMSMTRLLFTPAAATAAFSRGSGAPILIHASRAATSRRR